MKLGEPGTKRWLVRWNLCATLGMMVGLTGWHMAAQAHSVNTGDLTLDHPYAVPMAVGETHGKAYLRGISNAGVHPDRLLGASTPMADRVTLHRLLPHTAGLGEGTVEAIDLPAKTTTRLRHTGDYS